MAVRLPLPLVEVWEASKGRLTVGEVLDATAVSLEQCRALMGLAAVSPGAPDKIAAERLRLRDAVLVEFNHLRSNGNQGSHKSSTEFPALVTAALEQHTQHRLAGRFEAVLK
ncbi:MAG: hypothetical protein K6U09_12100 [Acidobacteriia bacterium]|nr:hypothetical protein [Terriglobia bacterium]